MEVQEYLRNAVQKVDSALDRFLPKQSTKPASIHKAMRYSMFAGGKRLRPALTLAAAELCGGTFDDALCVACAVECVHTYSLIHDDLPCMDDDDLRRGRPTCHIVFGEGLAVLAGDALLTLAFEILAQANPTPRYGVAQLISELSTASGSRWLIAGQVLDLEGEGKRISKADLKFIHESKTAALLTAALRLGGMSANVKPSKLKALTDFGRALGLAFQIIDDILDVTQPTEKLGKTAGKDVVSEKATYPSLFGLKKSRTLAAQLTEDALAALKPFGKKSLMMKAIAESMLAREY
ncbi:MAG: polyprenyl synthetase family protein [Verrucomicrobiota bacterium]